MYESIIEQEKQLNQMMKLKQFLKKLIKILNKDKQKNEILGEVSLLNDKK